MKTCPICHAIAFDDALVCYGCLYRYETEAESPIGTIADGDERLAVAPNGEAVSAPAVVFDNGQDDRFVSAPAAIFGDGQYEEPAPAPAVVFDSDQEPVSPHEAGDADGLETVDLEPLDDECEGGVSAVCGEIRPAAPEFVIRMVPVYEQSGAIAWSCSVDVANAQRES